MGRDETGIDHAAGRIDHLLARLGVRARRSPRCARRRCGSSRWRASHRPGSPVKIPSAPWISVDAHVSAATSLSCHCAERELGQSNHDGEQRDAGERDEEERREHARDVELEARLQDFVGEPGAAAAGAGDELGDHRADQRQPAGNAQAAEEIRQRARDAQPPQRLQPPCPVHAEQIEQARDRRCAGRAWCWR